MYVCSTSSIELTQVGVMLHIHCVKKKGGDANCLNSIFLGVITINKCRKRLTYIISIAYNISFKSKSIVLTLMANS